MKVLFFQAIVLSLAACSAHPKNATTISANDQSQDASSAIATSATTPQGTSAPVASAAPVPSASSSSAPSAHPPFSFVQGSPHDFFASDNDLLARYIQRERNPGWGAHADMAGGPGEEWLVDVFQYAIIVAPDLGGFFLRDFGTGNVSGVEARALTGSPKKDAVVRYFTNEGDPANGYRHEILEVWSIGNEGPIVRFAIELGAYAMCCGNEGNAPPHETSTVHYQDGAIDIVNDAPWRITPKFSPTSPDGILPRLPADVKSRRYRWDGSAFRLEKELK